MSRVIPADPVKAAKARSDRQAPSGILTAGCMIHYTGIGQRNYIAQTGFDRRVVKPEQVYVRDVLIGVEWTPLDTGWVKIPGVVLVVNKTAKDGTGTLLVGVGTEAFIQVFPGESWPLHPADVSKLVIRATEEDVPVTIHAFPG